MAAIDTDPDRHIQNADPDPANDADPTRSGSTTLFIYRQRTKKILKEKTEKI